MRVQLLSIAPSWRNVLVGCERRPGRESESIGEYDAYVSVCVHRGVFIYLRMRARPECL